MSKRETVGGWYTVAMACLVIVALPCFGLYAPGKGTADKTSDSAGADTVLRRSPTPVHQESVRLAEQAGTDYAAANVTLTFVYPETKRLTTATVFSATNTRPKTNLSAPVNASLGDTQAVGTVLGDDVAGGVAVFGAPSLASWNDDVRQKIADAGSFSQVDAFLVNSGYPVPTLAQLQKYQAVLVYSDADFNDNVGLGDVLADYIDAGGGVVLCTFAFHDSGGLSIQGRIKTAGYLPFSTASQNQFSVLTLIADLPSHPILNDVSSFNGGPSSFHNSPISITNGTTLVAHWSNGQPLVGAKEPVPGRIVGLNFYPPSDSVRSDFWSTNTQGGLLMANALSWAAQSGPNTNPPAIWQQPASQTVALGGTVSFSVGASGTGLSYQWRRDGTDLADGGRISGAVSNRLTIVSVQTNDAGLYCVVVTNDYGSALSSDAVLTVDVPQPPPEPCCPVPTNNATGVSVHTRLSWNGGGVHQNRLFAIRDSFDGLYAIDIATAQPTLRGPSGVTSSTCGLTESGGAVLYGSTWSQLSVIQIDGSGVLTRGSQGMEGMAYDASSGVLYGSLNGAFFTIDPATGNRLTTLPSWPDDCEGLAFVPSVGTQGSVYGIDDDGELHRYDIALGTFSLVGNTGLGSASDNSGLAYAPDLARLRGFAGSGRVSS